MFFSASPNYKKPRKPETIKIKTTELLKEMKKEIIKIKKEVKNRAFVFEDLSNNCAHVVLRVLRAGAIPNEGVCDNTECSCLEQKIRVDILSGAGIKAPTRTPVRDIFGVKTVKEAAKNLDKNNGFRYKCECRVVNLLRGAL